MPLQVHASDYMHSQVLREVNVSLLDEAPWDSPASSTLCPTPGQALQCSDARACALQRAALPMMLTSVQAVCAAARRAVSRRPTAGAGAGAGYVSARAVRGHV